jgi:hypothetical protein
MTARVNLQTGSYAIQPQDDGKLMVINSSSAATVTLPQPGDPIWLGVTFEFEIANIGAGAVTIAPTGSLIDGGGTLNLTTNQGVALFTDGSNYFTVRGTGTGGGGGSSLALETNGTPNGSQTLLNLVAGSNVTITDDGTGDITIAATGGGGSVPVAISQGPDWPPASPTASDDEFTEGSLNTTLWTNVVNGVPNTIQVSKSLLGIICAPHGSDDFTVVMQPVPASTPYTMVAKIALLGAGNVYAGMVLADSTGKLVSFVQHGSGNGTAISVDHWNSTTSWNNEPFSSVITTSPVFYLQIEDDGTNLHFSLSLDGADFYPLYSESRTAWLSAPAYIGLMAGSGTSGSPAIFGCDWFRRTA